MKIILASELNQLGCELLALAPELGEGSESAAEQSLTLCERVGQLAELLQAPALQEFATFLIGNVAAAHGAGAQIKSVGAVCLTLERCLRDASNDSVWSEFSAELSDATWSVPMAPDAASEIIEPFRSLSADTADESTCEPLALSSEDLGLKPAHDVNVETLHAYFAEAPRQAGELSALFATTQGSFTAPQRAAAQRLIHTLKGSSALVGLNALAHLSHAVEAAMARSADEANPFNTDLLSHAADTIESLIEAAAAGQPAPPDLQTLIDALYTQHSDAMPRTVSPAPAQEHEAVSAQSADGTSDALTATLNVPVSVIDDNLRRTGELNTAIGQLATQVAETLRRVAQLQQQLTRVQGQVYELETLVDTRGVPALSRSATEHAAEFDPLEMDEYTALHSLSRAFSESTLDSRELSRELGEELLKLQNLLNQHARLGRELSDSVTDARLVPVSTIASRLERIVRQTARQTAREVELTIRGRELSIDTDILNGLVEPLMHALRNAVDHGIEPSEERQRLGKPARGTIELVFRREGNRIEVILRDDGRGLNYEAIARIARERGLIGANATPTERELSELIFTPGFSTRSAVTAISGRGVGMDVVRTTIEKLKGTLQFESKAGAGSTLLLRLPLSLTSQHVLFVAIGDAVYGLPSTTVEQVLYSDAGQIVALGERLGFEYGGQISPLYSLATLLGHADRPLAELTSTPCPLVLVRGDHGIVALTVDRALDSRQTVIKGLSPLLPPMTGVAGAAVLPSGGIGIILELRELLREAEVGAQRTHSIAPSNVTASPQTSTRALVVDDSLSARRGLAQLLGDAGYTVATAIDGIDALTQMEGKPPDVVLLDMEMPRMNGLELTAHLRGSATWRDVPIIMITSRAADKHRTQALRTGVSDYVTKPYLEHDLIDRLYALAPP